MNFLGGPLQPQHMKLTEIDKGLGLGGHGVGQGQGDPCHAQDSAFDSDWTLPSRMDQSPMTWMIQVSDLIVDPDICRGISRKTP